MDAVITKFEQKDRKPKITDVRSGDTVRVHQTITEGGKKRVQVFEGMVIRTQRLNSLSASLTVRRIASGVGGEKTFFLHSPTIVKVTVVKRTKVRRNLLSYMRARAGKATRLSGQEFDKDKVNVKAEKVQAEPVSKEEAEALAKQAEEEKLGKKEAKAEKASEAKTTDLSAEAKAKVGASTKVEGDKKEAKTEKSEAKAEEETKAKDDKAAEKKAKAEEFRKAQTAKKK